MGSKIGIILAFLLSIAAAGGAYYLYNEWAKERAQRGNVEAMYYQVKEEALAAKAEREKFKSESAQYKAQSEEAQTRAQAMRTQLETLSAEQEKANKERADLEKQIKSHRDLIVNLQQKVTELDKKAKEAQQACAVGPLDMKQMPLTSTTSSTGTQLSFTPKTSTASTSSVFAEPATVSPDARTPGVQPAVPSTVTTEVAITPKVLTVNRKFNFVVVNLGLQDGLKMGDKLKVFKQGKSSATVQIEKLYDKFSAATILEENAQQRIAEGDEIRKS